MVDATTEPTLRALGWAPRGELAHLPAESLLRILFRSGIDVSRELCRILLAGAPNAVHWSVAALILNGRASLITVNVDELVETAIKSRLPSFDSRAYWTSEGFRGDLASASVVKLHGTASTGDLAFRSDQVILPMAPEISARIVARVRDARFVVYGYAARDFDVTPLLQDCVSVADSVVWFEPDLTAVARNSDRFSHYSRRPIEFPEAHGAIETTFLDWLEKTYWLKPPPSLALAFQSPRIRSPVRIAMPNSELAVPSAVSRFGDWSATRSAYRRVGFALARAGRFKDLLFLIGHRLEADIWNDGRVGRLATEALLSPLRFLHPMIRNFAYDKAITAKLNRGGYREALAVAKEAAFYRGKLGDRLRLCAAMRWAGELNAARDLAVEAYEKALAAGDASASHTAAFEALIANQWTGHMLEAKHYRVVLEETLGRYGGARWMAWSLWARAHERLFANLPGEAFNDLRAAKSIFEKEGPAQLPAVGAVALAMLTAARVAALERHPGFSNFEVEAHTLVRGLRMVWRPQPRQFADAVAFERAERHRAKDQTAEAYPIYLGLSGSSVILHRLAGLLGLIQLRLRRGDPCEEELTAIANEALAFGAGWHVCQAALSLPVGAALGVEAANLVALVRPWLPGGSSQSVTGINSQGEPFRFRPLFFAL